MLGIDLIEIDRVARAVKRDRFTERVFTERERQYAAGKRAETLAGMFAAKEAFLKAVGTGIGGGIALDEIAVEHLPGGAPVYRMTGAAQARLGELGAERAFLSLTHEAGMAAAVCVIE